MTYQTPYLEFFSMSGYSQLDILEDFIYFTSKKAPENICCALITDLPLFDSIYKSSSSISFLRVQIICSEYYIAFASANSLEILQLSRMPLKCVKIKSIKYTLRNFPVLRIDPFFSCVIIGDGKHLKMWHLKEGENTVISLGVHSCNIKDIDFHLSVSHCVVLSENFSCEIWDIQACKLLYTLRLQNITALTSSKVGNCILLGTKDGQVISFCPHTFHFIQLCVFPEPSDKSNYSDSRLSENNLAIHSPKQSVWSKDVVLNPSISAEFSNEVVSFLNVDLMTLCLQNDVPRISQSNSCLLIVLSRAKLYILNMFNHNIRGSWSWVDLRLHNWIYIHDAGITSSSRSVNFWVRGINDSIGFFTIPFEYLFEICDCENTLNTGPQLSFIARDNLLTSSVLNNCNKHQFLHNNINNKIKNQSSTFIKTSLNKPITFGHTIKSSGYAKQEPIRKMFHPITTGRPKLQNTSNLGTCKRLTKLTRCYPITDEMPNVLLISGSVDSCATPIYKVAYSPDGNSLASCLGNGICLITRSDQNTIEERRKKLFSSAEALRGHLGPILWASWSTNSRLLLTCSSDRTARIWRMGGIKELDKKVTAKKGSITQLIFDSVHNGATNDYGEKVHFKKTSCHVPFEDNITVGNFYYMDSFIYLVCQNIIRLYSYTLSNNKNILDKGSANNSYKLIGEFPISTCNQLTSVASINLFYSYLMICAGSDRRLSILDLNCGQIIQEIESAHNRGITGIALNQGSLYSGFDNSTGNITSLGTGYTTYATVAPKDCINLWDLRENRYPVIKLARFLSEFSTSGSSRNALIPPVTVVFSPCGTKLLVGGTMDVNQTSPVIYDVRKPCTHPLARLNSKTRMNNPATVVDWHPLKPEVSTGSRDGILSIYGIPKVNTSNV
ncbi:WD repeat-containing protein [Schistosoma japonicum]|uniref:WD repeat-containing protein n=1 Tax=Schistosoma japonicum TaxID=6182 RepID=A0A4Z2D6U0_SCHJA|nr:WD repeat-containing protein [Schistosoma japonicum]